MNLRPRMRRLPARISAATTLAVAAIGLGVAPPVAAVAALPDVIPAVAHAPRIYTHMKDTPPTTAQCEVDFQVACYSPNQYQVAYGVTSLLHHHIDGRGKTIAIVDAFGSPTIQADLNRFDADFGLPDTKVKVISPAGAPPAFDPTNDDQVGWAVETSLDVEYAHAMAPGAKILLVTTPVSETEGEQGFPQIVAAEKYVVRHRLADVITQSFGATENTFQHPAADIGRLRGAFIAAAKAHITVLASSGDAGATDQESDGTTLYPYRVNSWPSSDPLVTSVGGTKLTLDAAGHRTAPDIVWNDGYGAGGGGLSEVFARPRYQNGVAAVIGARRGTPDISMTAAVDGSALVYLGFFSADSGYYLIGGTSEASPVFSGIVALTDQVSHRDVGLINPALYGFHGSARAGVVDVTSGDNSFAGVTGYSALRGYDLASGWGTVFAPTFVAALARVCG